MCEMIYVKQDGELVGPFANVSSAKYEVMANGGFIVYQVAKVQ
mgnify:CR=1 FL=1